MDTKGIDQMLSVLRATAAQAGGKVAESQESAGNADFAQVLQKSIEAASGKHGGKICRR